jgi:hypothetical protein
MCDYYVNAKLSYPSDYPGNLLNCTMSTKYCGSIGDATYALSNVAFGTEYDVYVSRNHDGAYCIRTEILYKTLDDGNFYTKESILSIIMSVVVPIILTRIYYAQLRNDTDRTENEEGEGLLFLEMDEHIADPVPTYSPNHCGDHPP